jgi:hypothetical protein
MKLNKTKILTVITAVAVVLLPDLAMAGGTVVSDTAVGDAIDKYAGWVSDIDSKTLQVYKPFMGAAATVMGAGFTVRRIFK